MDMRERLETIIVTTPDVDVRSLAMSALTHLVVYRSGKCGSPNTTIHPRVAEERMTQMRVRYGDLIKQLGIVCAAASSTVWDLTPA